MLRRLPVHAKPEEYGAQAEAVLAAVLARDPEVLGLISSIHPHFFSEEIPWLAKDAPPPFECDLPAAQLGVARWYCFRTWQNLLAWAAAASDPTSPVALFEGAVEAVIEGDADTLRKLLQSHPDLVHARSTRVEPHDPPVHACTLLHYLGANGFESYRQRTPPNAVAIMKILLDAGAEADALANLYGAECTTLSMLISSNWPAQAGLQIPLAELLLDYGASPDGVGTGNWVSPVMTALVFGYVDAAEALVSRGAKIDTVAIAAGLGRTERTAELLPASTAPDRHRALAIVAQLGHLATARLLLEAGEDPNRYNPGGTHAHTTPLHQAALSGNVEMARLLVEFGARPDIEDTIYKSTSLGWANYFGKTEVEDYLRSVSNA